MSAEIRDLSNADYHASDGLSASGAKLLLPPSCPAIYHYRRDNPEYKGVFDFGSAAHKLVLGDASQSLAVVDANDWRSKAAREMRDAARAEGVVPVLAKEYEVVEQMAAAIRAHPLAAWLLSQPGTSEQSIFFDDERTGTPLRARLDYLPDKSDGRVYLADYKTAVSAERDAFSKTVVNYRYHVQAAFHTAAVRALGREDVAWFWIAQEKTPPYLVNVLTLEPVELLIGTYLMDTAINTYRECLKTDRWPGYSDEVETVTFPSWYVKQFEELI